jgi:hypothetical protein
MFSSMNFTLYLASTTDCGCSAPSVICYETGIWDHDRKTLTLKWLHKMFLLAMLLGGVV